MTESGIPIQFRHFIPRDEDLKFFIANDTPLDPLRILKAIESEMMECGDKARETLKSVTKTPSEPNWDLKREFARRNKKLEFETLRAIARHAGKSMDEEDQVEESAPEEEPERIVDTSNVVEDDEEDPEEFREARNAMAGISRHDLDRSEELD